MATNTSPPRTGFLPRLKLALYRLVETPESLPMSQRGQARLLAGLLLAVVLPALLGFIVLIVLSISRPSFLPASGFPVVGGCIVLLLYAYWLNRKGRYSPAAALAVLVPAIGIWVIIIADRNSTAGGAYDFLYTLVSVVLASILLSPRWTSILALAHIVGILVVQTFIPELDLQTVANMLVSISFLSLFIIVVAVVRQRDLVQLEQQSHQLAESEQRYRSIFETAQEGIWIIDSKGQTTYVNTQMTAMLGYTELEMLGHSAHEFVDQSVLNELEIIFANLQAGRAGHFDLRLRRKDGTDQWTIIAAQPMFDEGGQYGGALGLFTDITERKLGEEALRESEERFELVSWATRDIIWDWNLVTGEIWWSDGLQLAFQYPMGERQYNNDWWYAALHPDDLDKVTASIKATIDRSDQFWSKEYRFRRADGTYADIFDRGYILYDAEHKPKRFIGAMTDITARKQAEAALLESEARFKGAFDNAAIGMALVTLDGYWLQVNQALCGLLGYSAAELFEKNLHDLTYLSDAEADGKEEQELLTGSIRSYHIEQRYYHKQGGVVWVLLSKSLVRDFRNTPLYFIYQIEDISGRKEAEATLYQVNEKLAQGLSKLEQRSRDVARLNELGNVLQACMTLEEAAAAIDQSLRHLFPGDTGGLYMINDSHNLVEVMSKWGIRPLGQEVFGLRDCWALRRGRTYIVADLTNEPVCDHLTTAPAGAYICVPMMAQNEILGLLHLQVEAAPDGSQPFPEAKQQLAQAVADSVALALANLRLRALAQQQSVRDPLTGLFNRRYLEETLAREIARAARGHQQVGVIMIDVDHFKRSNDTLGHEAGDVLLQAIGKLLQQHSRESDIVCRYGGEEFILILPGASLDVTHQRAELLRVKAGHLQIKHHDMVLGTVTLSLGVAMYPEHGLIGADVVRAADSALYSAKNEGRNRVVIAETAANVKL